MALNAPLDRTMEELVLDLQKKAPSVQEGRELIGVIEDGITLQEIK